MRADPWTLLGLMGWLLSGVSAFSSVHHVSRIGIPKVATTMSVGSSGGDGNNQPLRRGLFSGMRKSTQVGASAVPISYRQLPIQARTPAWWSSTVSKVRDMDEVAKWRVAATAFLSSIVMFRPFLDAGLVKLWGYLQNSSGIVARAFRHDHWEWMVAITAFAVWIHGFWFADRAVLKAAQQGRVHPWRKFRLQDRYEAQKFQREQLRRQERGEDVDATSQPPVITQQSEWNWKAWLVELPVYAVPLFLWDYFIPRRAAKIATWGAPTTFQVCRDISCGLFLYDTFFFVGHLLMHKIPFIYNTIHKKHHINTECRAAEIVRLSMVEEVMEVGMSIVALNYLRAHPVSRTIYNCIITFLLTELHSGFDFPWTPQNVVPFGFATGSRRHHYHHRNGKHYYQKFFCHVDRIFGFIQKNDGSLMGDSVQEFNDVPSTWVTSKE